MISWVQRTFVMMRNEKAIGSPAYQTHPQKGCKKRKLSCVIVASFSSLSFSFFLFLEEPRFVSRLLEIQFIVDVVSYLLLDVLCYFLKKKTYSFKGESCLEV